MLLRIGKKAIIHTDFGDIQIELYGKLVPKTVENFSKHAQDGYYDDVVFHRVIILQGVGIEPGTSVDQVINKFMIQTGDPEGTGMGGSSIWGGDFEDEFVNQITLPFRSTSTIRCPSWTIHNPIWCQWLMRGPTQTARSSSLLL